MKDEEMFIYGTAQYGKTEGLLRKTYIDESKDDVYLEYRDGVLIN